MEKVDKLMQEEMMEYVVEYDLPKDLVWKRESGKISVTLPKLKRKWSCIVGRSDEMIGPYKRRQADTMEEAVRKLLDALIYGGVVDVEYTISEDYVESVS